MNHPRTILLIVAGLCGLALLSSCETGQSIFRSEPRSIVFRNATPHVLDYLEVRERQAKSDMSFRSGRFNGVPPESDQYMARRVDPPPLPDELVVEWRPRRGNAQQRVVSLRQALREATIGPRATLVIQINPDQTVSVYVTEGG